MAKKVYVDVIVREDREGNKRPLTIFFEDNKRFDIDRVIQVKRCAARKVGGSGIRYTVRVLGKETYLFEDDGRWFVEAKD